MSHQHAYIDLAFPYRPAGQDAQHYHECMAVPSGECARVVIGPGSGCPDGNESSGHYRATLTANGPYYVERHPPRRAAMAEAPPCGTSAAYRRHLRKGEPTDQACRAAHAEAQRTERKG